MGERERPLPPAGLADGKFTKRIRQPQHHGSHPRENETQRGEVPQPTLHSSRAAAVGRQVSGFWEGRQAGSEGTSKWAPETKVWAPEEDQAGVDAFDWP